jgi:hypothetical protein
MSKSISNMAKNTPLGISSTCTDPCVQWKCHPHIFKRRSEPKMHSVCPEMALYLILALPPSPFLELPSSSCSQIFCTFTPIPCHAFTTPTKTNRMWIYIHVSCVQRPTWCCLLLHRFPPGSPPLLFLKVHLV